jgi:streptogrisin C
VAQADQGSPSDVLTPADLPDVAEPQIEDPISAAELEDLKFVARQEGTSLQAAIDRYAWNDNFALAVASIREESPDAFTTAEIVDGGGAWVGFAAGAPDSAVEIIDAFEKAHATVAVDVRADFGFSETELEKAVPVVHYAVFEAAGVRDATTSFDFDTRQITSVVALESGVADAALDALHAGATASLVDAGLGGLLDSIAVQVVASGLPALGGRVDNNAHIGGEAISTCTTGFVVRNAAAVRGVSTAGHCQNAQTDDGRALAFQAGHEGAQGDFQWHTGPQAEPDDFYSGDADTLEVLRRDVAGVGAPVVNQTICKNGKVTFKDCPRVIQLNVCHFAICNLVQMDVRTVDLGDSGGPWYWGNTAYGLTYGWRFDPFPPFDRDLFSRADRIDNALGVTIPNT